MKQIFAILVVLSILVLAVKKEEHIPTAPVYSQPTEMEKFIHQISLRESGNKRTAVNKYGMMGKYQFAWSTVRMLGYKITQKQFLANAKLQDTVMVSYMRENNRELGGIIRRFNGKIFKGIYITRAGILAAAHLAGSTNVKQFFANADYNGRTDANGTSIRNYLTEFNKYNLRENF
jgi:hypothetical protein